MTTAAAWPIHSVGRGVPAGVGVTSGVDRLVDAVDLDQHRSGDRPSGFAHVMSARLEISDDGLADLALDLEAPEHGGAWPNELT